MFTGLIEDCGTISKLTRTSTEAKLVVTSGLPLNEIAIGDSVSVNGACLTVVAKSVSTFTVDMSPETFDRTTFSSLGTGSRVNLERALRVGDRLGGHFVTGHVDTVGTVRSAARRDNALIIEMTVPSEYERYLVPKGSVAIDGISLTVNDAEGDRFTVSIIPHTLTSTTLVDCKAGDRVNIETDLLGKYIERMLGLKGGASEASELTGEFLAKHGFM